MTPSQFYRAISLRLVDRLHDILSSLHSPTQVEAEQDHFQSRNLLAESHSLMSDAFTQAFLFRLENARSSGQYEYRFCQVGDVFESDWMERLPTNSHEQTSDERLVQLCIAPAILGAAGRGEEQQVLSHAFVI